MNAMPNKRTASHRLYTGWTVVVMGAAPVTAHYARAAAMLHFVIEKKISERESKQGRQKKNAGVVAQTRVQRYCIGGRRVRAPDLGFYLRKETGIVWHA